MSISTIKTHVMKALTDNMDNPSNSSMLTFKEAYKYLKVSKSFLYKATSLRTIPFYKPTGGKILRFDKKDLDQWQLQNRYASKNELSNLIK